MCDTAPGSSHTLALLMDEVKMPSVNAIAGIPLARSLLTFAGRDIDRSR
jgi:hypothetical protein